MLPPSLSGYLPHAGLLLLLVGMVFAVISAVDVPSTDSIMKNQATALNNVFGASRFAILAYAFILAGGFLLVGPLR